MQYADDTVIMVGGDPDSIRNLKFLLYCFEWMSGLKINYHKSEVLVFGVSKAEQIRMAKMLNCKIGSLPMTYLELPLSDRNVGAKSLEGPLTKMRKKLQPWKGKILSSRGRLMLTNSSLSSVPIYLMGMYRLYETNHQHMDSIRSKFFWRGDVEKFKYHMVKWEKACVPKDFGGLGITNTRKL